MKFVYVLVSNDKDYYTEEFVISLCSLRKHNPEADIVVIVDEETKLHLDKYCKFISQMRCRVIVKRLSKSISNKQKSRFLKISIREMIKGDFLYIDIDTVVTTTIDDSDFPDYISVGMVLDHHTMLDSHCKKKFLEYNSRKTGYKISYNGKHFNGGVIFSRDDESAREFWKEWKQLYKKSISRGVDLDQSALNYANYICKGIVDELDGTWNVQVDCGLRYISEAKIIHYLGYQPKDKYNKYYTNLPFNVCDKKILEKIKENRSMTSEAMEVINNPKSAFKNVIIIPDDSIGYELIFTNHFRILKYLYVNFNTAFNMLEKVYEKIFVKLFDRP